MFLRYLLLLFGLRGKPTAPPHVEGDEGDARDEARREAAEREGAEAVTAGNLRRKRLRRPRDGRGNF